MAADVLAIHGDSALKTASTYDVHVSKIVDFSANLNPYGPPPGLTKHLRQCLTELQFYPPETRRLKQLLAAKDQTQAEQIILGNGSAELIYFLTSFFKPKTALLIEPAFTEYRRALTAVGCRISTVFAQPEADFQLDIKKLKKKLTEAELVFICNPNNPTGYLFNTNILIQLVQAFPDVIFVVDEAFLDFTGQPSLARQTLRFFNLIVLRSLTKFYRLPGLRLGYLVVPPQLSQKMVTMRPPWVVNSLAIRAGEFVLQQTDFAQFSCQRLEKAKNKFVTGLNKINWLKVYPSAANFFLVELKTNFTADYLADKLLKSSLILIRKAASFLGLNQKFLRLAVLKPAQNKELIKVLKKEVFD